MEILVGLVSLISLLIAAFTAYILATIENRLTQKFELRFITRNELDILLKERNRMQQETQRRLDELAQLIKDQRNDLIAEIREVSNRLNAIHDEFGAR